MTLRIRLRHDFRGDDPIVSWRGPIFHRWLPDGRADALQIPLDDAGGQVVLWFEPRASRSDSGIFRYDQDGDPVDPARVARQGVVDAGILFVDVELIDVNEDTLESLAAKVLGDEPYVRLGQYVAKRVIQPHVVRAVATLRTALGQYWLEPLESWDERFESLGMYFTRLDARWSVDGQTWNRFVPDVPESRRPHRYLDDQYLQLPREADWRRLQALVQSGYEPSVVSRAVLRASMLRDRGDVRMAFVEAVTAMEIAVSEFARAQFAQDKRLARAAQAFWNLPFAAKLTTTALWRGVPSALVADAAEGYAMRNAVAHEGNDVPAEAEKLVKSMLQVCTTIAGLPLQLLPAASSDNEARPSDEHWERFPAGPQFSVGGTSMSHIPKGFKLAPHLIERYGKLEQP